MDSLDQLKAWIRTGVSPFGAHEMIAVFLDASFTWLCEALARHEDPESVKGIIAKQLMAYVDESAFWGKRLLDFGCGTGASTFCLAAMFPDTEVIGVELDEKNIRLARRVLAFRQLPNVQVSTLSGPQQPPARNRHL